jgi:NADH-quinone oxidoreductase subunit L
MSLFCFSMLGLVIAGNIAMVFVFWELVGICSYFLIGFYIERRSACNAANKAFIVNRIGDFGMIVGLMALWGSLGTFAFGDKQVKNDKGEWVVARNDKGEIAEPGIFSLVRPAKAAHDPHAKTEAHGAAGAHDAHEHHAHELTVPAGMLASAADAGKTGEEQHDYAYWLLIVAGIGIFCGCVGKSAQFPLHVWLPDAMEGPTPVSALVHSATMVAAGVYLVGRFYPAFTPEVLLVIAIVGAITLFLAATIAITAVDIKRVLAYSTVSQLGYMMLALGLGGWIAGLFHLVTHAFFKSLLFLCSGSVIHACHTNDMRKMGGLLGKMPYTGYTMLVGCLAIIGAGVPGAGLGVSGYYSKDSILAQAFNFGEYNPSLRFFFPLAAAGAAITAFYMFRMWFMTFLGKPRDHHVHEHVHESPPVMYVPLLILAFFAVTIGWKAFWIPTLLDQALPLGADVAATSDFWFALHYPPEHLLHGADASAHTTAELAAFGTAIFGVFLAGMMYWKGLLNPADVRAYFSPIYRLLWNKWYFDEIYWAVFVRPTLFVSRLVAKFDRAVIDWLIDGSARVTVRISRLDDQIIDRTFVDGLVNLVAAWIYSLGIWLRRFQTGHLRQYVTFIVVGTVALFVIISFWSRT